MARSRLTDEQVLDADFLSEGEYNILSTTMSGHLSDQILTTSGVLQDQIDNITIGAGVTDHGELTGLSDDDHAQYLLTSSVGDRDTFADSWAGLTASGTTALHTHSSSSVDHNQTTNTHNLTTDINHNTITNTHQNISSTASPTFSGILITNGATINGNLTVSGTTFTTRHEIVEISDNLLLINNGEVGAGISKPGGLAGIEVERGTLTNYQFVFDEASDNFKIGQLNSLQPVATRQDSPTSSGVVFWNNTLYRFDTISNFIYSNNCLYINETSNAFSTVGLTINQGAADDDILTFKSSDVNQPVTAYSENDTFAQFSKAHATGGGLKIAGYSDSSNSLGSLRLVGSVGATSLTATYPAIGVEAYKSNGSTGTTTLGDSEIIFQIANNSAAKWYITGNGDVSQTGNLTINSDLADVTSTLTFGRTTGGNATATYSGTSIDFNKVITSTSDIVSGALVNPMSALVGRGVVITRDTHTENNIIAYGGGNSATRYYASGGTYTSPTATLAGQAGFIGFTGYANSTYVTGSRAVIGLYADTDWTASSQSTYIGFKTTATGSVTMVETMRLNGLGQLSINTTTFLGSEKLRVNGNISISSDAGSNTFTSIKNGVGLGSLITYGDTLTQDFYTQLLVKSSGTTIVTINSTGLGVGSPPSHLLTVSTPNSSLNNREPLIVGRIGSSGYNGQGLYSTADVVTGGLGMGLSLRTWQSNIGIIEPVYISHAGQVGINATSFIGTEKLLVNGSVVIGIPASAYAASFLNVHTGVNNNLFIADLGEGAGVRLMSGIDGMISYRPMDINASTLYLNESSGGQVAINASSFIGSEILRVNGQIYSDDNISGLSFTDRTPFYEADALSELMNIKGKNGEIDHSTLPKFTQREFIKNILTKDLKNTKEVVIERDLGAMISVLIKGIQQLVSINKDMQTRLDKLDNKNE